MRIPAQEKYRAVTAVVKDGKSVSKVAKIYNIARKTLYGWIKRYKSSPQRLKNSQGLENKYLKGDKHPRAYRHLLRNRLSKIVVRDPSLSATSLSKKLGVGRHAVVGLMSELKLGTRQDREAFGRIYAAPGRLLAGLKGQVVREILEAGKGVSQVARKWGVARKTIYIWLARYQEEGRVQDKYVAGNLHPRAFSAKTKEAILGAVAGSPQLSIHQLAKTLSLSSHGVYNVLKRHGLTYKEARLDYAEGRLAGEKAIARPKVIDRVRSVFEQFIPSLAPAPPPSTVSFFKVFGLSSLASFTFFLILAYWYRLFSQNHSLAGILGLSFASIALLMGSFFFLYSLKYYLTLAIVLSFSQSEQSEKLKANGKKGGFLASILGLGKGNGNGTSAPSALLGTSSLSVKNGYPGAVGLESNLDHIILKRYPFVSIHIPLYNEKNVVNRVLKASTSFEYEGEYEVIICDDSTDETTQIIGNYLKTQKLQNSKIQKGEGWILEEAEVRPGVTLKHLHRTTRSGFKGGALRLALSVCDPRAEFVSVFDADFVPYPDTLTLFLKYFSAVAEAKADRPDYAKASTGRPDYAKASTGRQAKGELKNLGNIAAVQGYQWHVLNKSENWITRGVRSEYAGSYVIERSGEEIYGGLKQISGSVYMIRKDVLTQVGWGDSITEDFELTLKLYNAGYKVIYTPYIQAPAECVSTIKRLVRQRMRWAEGHSHNVRRMFTKLLFGKWIDANVVNDKIQIPNDKLNSKSNIGHLTFDIRNSEPDYQKGSRVFIPSPLTISEKLEFLYLAPYYLQAFFFLIGTLSWLISETVFKTHLPFWTELWGWSLVLTNLLALPLMNAVGLFLEESEEKDYAGIASFVALSYIVVPFQAYASLKGFLERTEGPWFRTPKTGRITDIFTRGRFYRFIQGILPGRGPVATQSVQSGAPSLFPALAISKITGFSARKRTRWFSRATLSIFILIVLLLNYLSFFTPKAAYAQAADPGIEQQINIINQELSTTNSTYSPTDNSLGLFLWDSTKYSGDTVYFEVVMKCVSCVTRADAALFSSGGTEVSGSSLATTSTSYVLVRSGALTQGTLPNLQSGVDYTVRIKCFDDGGGCGGTIAYIKAARIVIVQSDATNITDTVTQIELGDDQSISSQTYTGLSAPKYFYLDKDKYDGTVTAKFEASLLGSQGRSGTQAVFMSGFETGDEIEWTSESATATTAQFRSGAYSVLLNDTGSEFVSRDDTASANIGVRFGLRLFDSTPSSNQDVLTISSTATNNWIIHVLTDGKVRIQNLGNGTNYDSTNTVFADNTWHLVEFRSNVHDSAGFVGLRVDGAVVISQGVIDTNNAVTTVNRIRFDGYASGVGDIWVDDVYRINSNAYPGDGKIVALQPNGSGDEASANWTVSAWPIAEFGCAPFGASYSLVLETPHGNFTTCTTSGTSESFMKNTVSAGGTILFGLEDASAGGIGANDTINDVWYRMWAKRGAGSGTTHAIRKKWAGTAASSSNCGLGTSGTLCSLQEAGTLSVTNVDSAQLGADKQSGAQEMYVETEWMMVDYFPATKVRLETATSESGSWTAVTGGELTSSSSSWSRVRTASSIWANLTDDQFYRVAVDIDGSTPQNIANAKLIIEQTAAGGLTAVQMVHMYVNSLTTVTATGFTDTDFDNQYTPGNWVGGTFTYYFEAVMQEGGAAATANARLSDTNITSDELSSDSTTYDVQKDPPSSRTALGSMPGGTTTLDTQVHSNSASVSANFTSSWLIIEVSNLQIPENLLIFLPLVLFIPVVFNKRFRANSSIPDPLVARRIDESKKKLPYETLRRKRRFNGG